MNINKNVFVAEAENVIVFDIEYFKRIFIKSDSNNPLSLITLRIAALLLLYLSETEARKLPKRKEIELAIGVSKNSVTNSLLKLLEIGFIKAADPIKKISIEDLNSSSEYEEKTIANYSNIADTKKEERTLAGFYVLNKNFMLSNQQILCDILFRDNTVHEKIKLQQKFMKED